MTAMAQRVNRLEHARRKTGGVLVCHRYGPQDDARIDLLEKQAEKEGKLLVVINTFYEP